MNKYEAWVVGLYEGEGSTGIIGKKKENRVCISNTTIEVLYKTKEILGYGRVDLTSKPPMWRINDCDDVINFFQMAWSLLSERRKIQAAPVIKLAKSRSKTKRQQRTARSNKEEIIRLYKTGNYKQSDLAKMFNASQTNISRLTRESNGKRRISIKQFY